MPSPQDFVQGIVNDVKEEAVKNTITIKDQVYKVKLLDADDGIDTWEFIMQKLLPSVGSGLDGMNHDDILHGAPTTFSEVMLHLSKQLDGNTLKALSLTVLEGLTVDGSPVEFKEHFKGNYGTWTKVLKFALQENFSSFFDEGWENMMTDLMGAVTPMMSTQVDPQPAP